MKLMCQGYGTYGWNQFWASIFCFFMIMNDFGFPPASILNKNTIHIFRHDDYDKYSPNDLTFGNSKLSRTSCNNPSEQIDWLFTVQASQDLRMSALNCKMVNGSPVYTHNINFG